MSNEDMRRLFEGVLTAPRPDTTDIDSAMSAGRRRRRRRTATVALSSLAVVAVVGVVVAGALPKQSAPGVGTPSATGSSASVGSQEGAPITAVDQLSGSWWTVTLDGEDVHAVRDRSGNPLLAAFRANDADATFWWGANDGCNDHGGKVSVSGGGLLFAEGGSITLVGCFGGTPFYPRNPEVVQLATQARVVAATSTTPKRLVLLADGKVLAVYEAVPDAATRPGGTVLTSGPSDDPGSGMAAIVTGKLTLGKDDCFGLDGQSTVFPQGTSWAPSLGLLILPDGSTARPGDTITGGGGYIDSSTARKWVEDPSMRGICTWSTEVRVFNKGASIAVAGP